MTEINVLHRVLKATGALTRRRNRLKRGVHRMIHSEILVKSGKHTLQKLTKTQARNEIKKNGSFTGFLCGNRVNPSHIADGWYLGIETTCTTLPAFEQAVDQLELGLRMQGPELGTYAHYYKIVDAEMRNKKLRRHYAQKRSFSQHPEQSKTRSDAQ